MGGSTGPVQSPQGTCHGAHGTPLGSLPGPAGSVRQPSLHGPGIESMWAWRDVPLTYFRHLIIGLLDGRRGAVHASRCEQLWSAVAL